MQEKLRTLRKIIEKRSNPSGDPSKVDKNRSKKSIEEAEVATEEVKKKIQTGAITVKKQNEKSTFKRAKLTGKRTESTRSESLVAEEDGEIIDTDFLLASPPPAPLLSPTKSSAPIITSSAPNTSHWVGREMENRGKRIYIRGYDLQSESLKAEFARYGKIERVTIIDRNKSAFITFEKVLQAEKAIKEMDGNMVNGITIRVSFAHRQHEPGEKKDQDQTRRRDSESGNDKPDDFRRERKRSERPSSESNDESSTPGKSRKMVKYSDDDLFGS
ncbi:hypothetical protein WR25_19317 [Diploscapter pachys]|uniref:Negative elongation factor E n=1 Tax=Diploscapter pachys TaxID=2018661 RepID=A0A2A2JUZ7_9BILA|nr:hypothetical protein WR25_19317 [Diploscapter pachys]